MLPNTWLNCSTKKSPTPGPHEYKMRTTKSQKEIQTPSSYEYKLQMTKSQEEVQTPGPQAYKLWTEKNHKVKKRYTLGLQEYKLWMAKQKVYIKWCFVELCNDLILLKIVNFHKYVGSSANEITKCSQIGTYKRQRGHKKKGSVRTQTYDVKPLPGPSATYTEWPSSPPTTCSHIGYPSWTAEERQLRFTSTNSLQTPPTTCSHASCPS